MNRSETATVTPTIRTDRRLRVLLIAPYFNRDVPGESWVSYRWIEEISKHCDTTVLTTHPHRWNPASSPLPGVEVVNWPHTKLKGALDRFDNELKPHFLPFHFRARRWIRRAVRSGRVFDLAHQINPVAMRYPCPVRGLEIPYVLGPHCGSLPTPPGFREECRETKWYRKLRDLDRWRLKFDPWLRGSFRDAAAVLGFAPYVRETLRDIPLRRFELVSETGPSEFITSPKRFSHADEPLRLIFVGRIIRTKGTIDAVRAFAAARRSVRATLEIIGTGDMLDTCKLEAERLGVSSDIQFSGRLPRSEVFQRYQQSDVCLFPSFREPSGNVIFEAMGFGLPMISTTVGGPGYLVAEDCGIRVEPSSPAAFVEGLAAGIVHLAQNRQILPAMSAAAVKRSREIGSWENRSSKVLRIYREIAQSQPV